MFLASFHHSHAVHTNILCVIYPPNSSPIYSERQTSSAQARSQRMGGVDPLHSDQRPLLGGVLPLRQAAASGREDRPPCAALFRRGRRSDRGAGPAQHPHRDGRAGFGPLSGHGGGRRHEGVLVRFSWNCAIASFCHVGAHFWCWSIHLLISHPHAFHFSF